MIILESERLVFRQHEPADIEGFCAMEMDPEVRRYVGGAPRSRVQAERKFQEGPLVTAPDRLGVWATLLKPDGPYIGRCGLYPHFGPGDTVINGEATLAFYIARPYWRRGFASEAGRAFIQFGWQQLRLLRIVATVEVGNEASVHVLEKLGFKLVTTERGVRSFFKFEIRRPVRFSAPPD